MIPRRSAAAGEISLVTSLKGDGDEEGDEEERSAVGGGGVVSPDIVDIALLLFRMGDAAG